MWRTRAAPGRIWEAEMASIVKRKKKFSVVYSYTDEKGIEQ